MTADAPLQQRFGLTVTPQNVLGVRAVVLQEAQELDAMLHIERERVALPSLGGDPVSKDMSAAFNSVTDQLLARATQHVDSLFKLGEELGATAKMYGHTEGDVAASFGPQSPRTEASGLTPTMRELSGMGASAAKPQPRTITDLLSGGSA